eukprot:TRINITY_DN4192_c0_g1_i7.p1 TRINITY_DN4192_c0_g1~~TRINITY_DN4192_c0_g1_i7.p1  ORF type:complete len:333 (+),score=46.44 TRINITY_DN4192_c0_g1_i7:64-1062(+)
MCIRDRYMGFKYFFLKKSLVNTLQQMKAEKILDSNALNDMDKTVGYMARFLEEILNQKSKEENELVEQQAIRDYWLSTQVCSQYRLSKFYKRIDTSDGAGKYLLPKADTNLLNLLSGQKIFKNIFDCLDQKQVFLVRVCSKKFNDEVLKYVRDNVFSTMIKVCGETEQNQEQITEVKEKQEKAEELWGEAKSLLEEINPRDFQSILGSSNPKPETQGLIINIAKLLGMKKTTWEGLAEEFDFAEFMKRAEELDLALLHENKNFNDVNTFILENSIQKLTRASLTSRFISLWIHKLFEAARNYPYDEIAQKKKNEVTKRRAEALDGMLKVYGK